MKGDKCTCKQLIEAYTWYAYAQPTLPAKDFSLSVLDRTSRDFSSMKICTYTCTVHVHVHVVSEGHVRTCSGTLGP